MTRISELPGIAHSGGNGAGDVLGGGATALVALVTGGDARHAPTVEREAAETAPGRLLVAPE